MQDASAFAGGHATGAAPPSVRVLALSAVAQYHGVSLDPEALRHAPGIPPSAADLLAWARAGGLEAKAARLNWRRLTRLRDAGPVLLLLADGGAALMMRADRARNVVWVRDPAVPRDQDGVPVDELRLRQVWSGEALLIRSRVASAQGGRLGFRYLFDLVMTEHRLMRDVMLASLVLSLLAMLPALTIMVVFTKVVPYQAINTLDALIALILLGTLWETLLGFARRRLINAVGTRVDIKLTTIVFSRVLGLPIDFFERRQTGAIMFQVSEIRRIREFLTGKLLATLLDLVTVAVMLPVLFYLSATLTWMIIALGGACGTVILVFLGPIRAAYRRWIKAEMERSTVMLETVHGIRTVKSLSLERQQRELFDKVTAESAIAKERLGYISNWPETLATVIEALMTRGVMMAGALITLVEGRGDLGVLFAFMMLGGRLANPLTNMARLIQDLEEVRGAIAIASDVVDNGQEVAAPNLGSRPEVTGAIRFDHVDFGYPGTRSLALEDVSFFIPAGASIGLVGRSGSGKSTVTRLLQGFATGFDGAIEIDGHEIRGINLEYLRGQFGVVLQDNFLFRGSIRDNIIAGRPGLTLSDAVQAARLAGAEEFIERLPRRLRNRRRGRLAQPLGRPAPTPGDRARADPRPAHPDPGRGHLGAGPGERGAGERQHRPHRPGPHDAGGVAPDVVADRDGPDHRARPRPGDGYGAASRPGGPLPGVSPALAAADALHGNPALGRAGAGARSLRSVRS